MDRENTVKRKEKYHILVVLTAVVLVIVVFASGDIGKSFGMEGYNSELLRFTGWKIRSSDSEEPVELPCYLWEKTGSCFLTNTLPRALGAGSFLAFRSSGCTVRVYVGGSLIYTNAGSYRRTVRETAVYNYVPLNESYAGSSVTVEFSPVDDYHAGILPEMLLGTRSELVLYAKSMDTPNVQMSYSITFLGLIVLLLSITVFSYERSFGELVALGLYLTLCGITQFVSSRGYLSYPLGSGLLLYTFSDRFFLFLPVVFCFYCVCKAGGEKPRLYRYLIITGFIWFASVCVILSLYPHLSWKGLRDADHLYVILMYAMCLYQTLVSSGGEDRKYTVLTVSGIIPVILGVFLGALTHAGYAAGRRTDPVTVGMLVSSLMLTFNAAVTLYRHFTEQLRMQKELSESRMTILLDQMKSHFIRNCISTIRAMIRHDPDRAYSLMYDFSDYITYNIDSLKDPAPIPLSDEIDHIRAYVNLETERMRPKLSVEYDIRCTDVMVPPLSIQPFAENAVKHGIWPKDDPGTVWISSSEEDGACILTIRDDGVGFDTSEDTGEERYGIGITNAMERLRDQAGATVEINGKKDEGTVVTIRIPVDNTI